MTMRQEYPRPDFQRERWMSLNGTWKFDSEPNSPDIRGHWGQPDFEATQEIAVPFCPESELSGLHDTRRHEVLYYERTFEIPEDWEGERILLHFGAVDYRCEVFVNDRHVGAHEGGHVGFTLDISSALKYEGQETVKVWVEDPSYDEAIPRGKQCWTDEPTGIWYTRTSGIWQSVWLEPVSEHYLEACYLTPLFDDGLISLKPRINHDQPGLVPEDLKLRAKICFGDEVVSDDTYAYKSPQTFERQIPVFGQSTFTAKVHDAARCWTPEHPHLFDLELTLLKGEQVLDQVKSYFGMRKIHTENGQTYLNNRPYEFRLVLDQGYWPEGLMTAPRDEDFQRDIELTKAMGFNGARKHQKVEDPRFLYWADHMGLLVWGEMAAASIYTPEANLRLTREWMEVVKRDYNHPSIVCWVPFNESWGVPDVGTDPQQQAHTRALYHLLHSLDATRLVSGNDGWEQCDTDICAIHNYSHGNPDDPRDARKRERFMATFVDPDLLLSDVHAGRAVFVGGHNYEGQPILMTEIGGIAYRTEDEGWGYTAAKDADDYERQLRYVMDVMHDSPIVFGYCYTQLTDVEQETNGLLSYSREPKLPLETFKEIFEA